jgi:DNA-binding response OmpR family regulator
MNILIIEEQVRESGFLQQLLAQKGFPSEEIPTGIGADDYFLRESYDLVIIDVDSPDLDGTAVCRSIRHRRTDIAILIVSALDTPHDKVQGLDSGADDYLVKPFHTDELLARMKALTRRKGGVGQVPTRKAADVEIDAYKRTVIRNGKRISLTATEFALLDLLMSHKNRVLPRKYISEAVWGIGFDRKTNLVDVYINYLRHKIDVDFNFRLIHTVTGQGYVFKEE